MDSLDNSSGRWGTGAVPGCLVLGPRMIQGKGNIGLVCELGKKVAGGMDSGLVGLYVKGGLTNRLFTVSRN